MAVFHGAVDVSPGDLDTLHREVEAAGRWYQRPQYIFLDGDMVKLLIQVRGTVCAKMKWRWRHWITSSALIHASGVVFKFGGILY